MIRSVRMVFISIGTDNMQDRYTGDLGDFSKLGILRALEMAGLSIGVNWYLTPDDNHNGDGRHVKYLDREEYKACDAALWLELKNIVESNHRKACYLENENILQACFTQKDLILLGRRKLKESLSESHGTMRPLPLWLGMTLSAWILITACLFLLRLENRKKTNMLCTMNWQITMLSIRV